MKVRKNDIQLKSDYKQIKNMITKDRKLQADLRRIIKQAMKQNRLYYSEIVPSGKFVAKVDQKKYQIFLKNSLRDNTKELITFVEKGMRASKKVPADKVKSILFKELVKLQKSTPFNAKIIHSIEAHREITPIMLDIYQQMANTLMKEQHAMRVEFLDGSTAKLARDLDFKNLMDNIYKEPIKKTLKLMGTKEINYKTKYNYKPLKTDLDSQEVLGMRLNARKLDIYAFSVLIAYNLIQLNNKKSVHQTLYIECEVENTVAIIDRFDTLMNNRVNQKLLGKINSRL